MLGKRLVKAGRGKRVLITNGEHMLREMRHNGQMRSGGQVTAEGSPFNLADGIRWGTV